MAAQLSRQPQADKAGRGWRYVKLGNDADFLSPRPTWRSLSRPSRGSGRRRRRTNGHGMEIWILVFPSSSRWTSAKSSLASTVSRLVDSALLLLLLLLPWCHDAFLNDIWFDETLLNIFQGLMTDWKRVYVVLMAEVQVLSDLVKFYHFGTMFLTLWPFRKGSFTIRQKFELTLANYVWFWANVQCCK